MTPGAKAAILAAYRLNISQLANNAAWYSLAGAPSDSTYLLNSGNVTLIADKTPNSQVNGLVLNGVEGNFANFSTLTAFGTSDFTAISDFLTNSIAVVEKSLFAGNTSSFQISINRTAPGSISAIKTNISESGTVLASLAPYTRYVVAYVRASGVGQFYINGIAFGSSFSDTANYSIGCNIVGNQGSGGGQPLNGTIFKTRVYTTALNATSVLADYNGTVQANCVLNVDFTLQAKLATSFTATTGGAVTINTSGDYGARICGARDHVVMTAAKRAPFSVENGFNVMTPDGSNDTYKTAPFVYSQPCTRYTVFKPIAWNSGNVLWAGNTANTGKLSDVTGTPQLQLNAGSAGPTLTTFVLGQWAVAVETLDGAASSLGRNLQAENVADAGAGNPTGDTLGSDNAGANNANLGIAERLLRNGHDTPALKAKIVNYFLRYYNGLITVP